MPTSSKCPSPSTSTTTTTIDKGAGEEIWTNLLAPLNRGKFNLSHRVVLAPVTRCRALDYVPQLAHVEFYAKRATFGGLLITEAVAVAQEAIGFPHSPGIWAEEQVVAWRRVVAAVHDKGGLIFCQLWHVGRASHTYYQPEGCKPVSSTSRRLPSDCTIRLPNGAFDTYAEPRALETSEIAGIVDQFRRAARNARRAAFDGVEIHAGHGYLIDQFFKDGINDRTDDYGGSMQNRCRFGLEVMAAVAAEMGGEERTAIRISPVIDHLGATDSDPVSLGLHFISELNKKKLAYLHMTEPRFNNKGASGLMDTADDCGIFREAYNGVLMRSGGYTRESGMETIRSGGADLISFGRLFISNPDLPLRFAIESKLNVYDRSTFYTHEQYEGYLDYPCLSEKEVSEGWAALRRRRKSARSGRTLPGSLRLNSGASASASGPSCGGQRVLYNNNMLPSPSPSPRTPHTPLLAASPTLYSSYD